MVISDAATGMAFARAALYGAAVNVKVNTKLMKDRAYASALNEEIDRKLDAYTEIADAVYEEIYAKYSDAE